MQPSHAGVVLLLITAERTMQYAAAAWQMQPSSSVLQQLAPWKKTAMLTTRIAAGA
jgi:hypothetical protein